MDRIKAYHYYNELTQIEKQEVSVSRACHDAVVCG